MPLFLKATESVELPHHLYHQLQTFCAREEVTLFSTLLASLKGILFRHTGQGDLTIGSLSTDSVHLSGPHEGETYVNPVALRTNLAARLTGTELLQRVNQTVSQAAAYRDHAFETVVNLVGIEQPLNRSPIFQIMFALLGRPSCVSPKPASADDLAEIGAHSARCDLTVTAVEDEGQLRLTCEYDSALFEAQTIRRLLSHLLVFLEGIINEPTAPLWQLPLLTEAERQQLLADWNQTERDYPRHLCVHQLFEQQAAKTPDAVAVTCGTEQLTYHELNSRVNRLAHYLQARGVRPNTLVGICMERSLDLVVGLLGILKAGGTYVPLDPTLPQDRLSFMLSNADVTVLLTQEKLQTRIPRHQAQVVCIDAHWPHIRRESADNPTSGVTADHLIYVIYTSGSTGRPKGAGVFHRGFANLLHWFITEFDIAAEDRVLLVTPISFDLAQKNVYAPLAVGGQLHLLPTQFFETDVVRRCIEEDRITLLNCTPSAFYLVLEDANQKALSRLTFLRHLFLGGEPIAMARLQPWISAAGVKTEIVNTYGPTECTDVCAFHRLTDPQQYLETAVPIGKPIFNTQLLILDEKGQLVPVGVAGELCIAGDGVGMGYLNDARLTAASFVPHPFSPQEEVRIYRTGDLARWRTDGTIEFRGRIDYQVKLRGFRIELGEIETTLNQHPSVAQSTVVVHETSPDDQRLIAYGVPTPESVLRPHELHDYLKTRLPDYMLPSAFVPLDAFPLTPNGKIDRQALPVPEQTRLIADDAFVAPRSPAEELVAEMWAQVLGVTPVGIHDNFFALGGHSLLAAQIIAQVRRVFHVELSLRHLFQAATVAELAQLIAANQRQPDQAEKIARLSRRHELPLSPAQQRLWLLDRLEPGNVAYNVPIAFRLVGSLDSSALRQSLRQIVRRHQILRTTITVEDGRPVQTVAPAATADDLPLPVFNCQPDQVPARMREEFRRPFDLSKGPLLRAVLLHSGETEHFLLLTVHHLVFDGWSQAILYRELTTLYQSLTAGKPPPLPELPIQYADFAIWQRQQLQRETAATQLTYWQKQLEGAPAVLSLPTDHPRPPVQSFAGASTPLRLSGPLTKALKALSHQENATPFMTLLAAFTALLYRVTGQLDIVVGSPVANRSHPQIEKLIGFFVNTLPLRTQLSPQWGFRQLLAHVRQTALAAYSNQDLPFERLVEAVQPERQLNHTPLFQIMFVFNATAPTTATAAGLRFEPLDAGNDTAKFDLTLRLTGAESTLYGALEYNVDLFEAATIGRMAGHFTRLLQGIVAQPERPLAQLPLLSKQEQRQLLVTWQSTQRDYPALCVQQLFEAQVKRTPEATAVCFEKESLSYRSLNNRANQLAHHLKKRGIGSGTMVGLYLERSFDLAVGLLAVWKAGAAYVPLDVDFPRARLAHMLRQTGPSLLLTREPLLAQLPPYAGQIVCLDRDRHLLANEAETDPPPTATPDDLAYVVYTSGSTGQPKGILTRHSSVINYLTFLARTYAIDEDTTVLQLPAISFDASVRDMIGPLTAGGRVVIVSNAEAKDPTRLVAKMRQHGVNTLLSVVPTMLRALTETIQAQGNKVDTVKLILTSGERLFWHDCRQARLAFGPSLQLVNQYGPSECTMTSSYYRVSEIPDSQDGVPIGRPIDNVQIYILDPHLNPAPVGVVGEIYIGGAGLAQGYLQRPELTAAAFIPHPFSPTPGARLYKTGDLGRFCADGTITFLGRRDHQVKIGGVRVEPGEIEAVLGQHPAVYETAVTVVEGQQPGQKSLVAYIVPRQEQAPSPATLRRFLRQQLPAYMVPATIVPLAALPRTPHGKIDRQALPAPDQAPSRQRFIGPRTPAEQIVTDTWSEVLGVSPISINDNFFELGGHSLLAAQLIHRLNHRFQIALPLRTLFEAPTVAGVAAAVVRQRRAQTVARVAWHQFPGRLEGQDKIYPLSFGQQRLWFLDQLYPDNAAYNTHFAARLRGSLDVAALKQSLHQVVRRHQILRTTFVLKDGVPVQVVAPNSEFGLQIEDLRSLPAAEQPAHARQRLVEEISRSFDLKRGPLLRAKLLHLEDETLFCLVMHHIITDGWSYQVLLKELATWYDHLVQEETPPPEALPLQYGNFAAWQRHRSQVDGLDALLAYWKQQLSGAPARLALPTDRPRPLQQSFQGAEEQLLLSQDLSQELKTLSFQQGVTPFMLLLAAFKVLIYRLSGQSDILVGTPIAGRTQVDLESLIGFFVNTLVLRTQITDEQTFKDVVQRVRQTSLAAYEHQELPFEKLVEALQPQRDAATPPLFQVTFVFQNTPPADLSLAGVTVTPFAVERNAARVDLALYGQDTGPRLAFTLVYDSDLFAAKTVRHWLGHFEALLASIAANPNQPVAELLPSLSQTRPQPAVTVREERPPQPAHVPPRDPWELQLVQLWEALLPARPIGVTTSFFDLGGHSLLAIRLLHRIEQQFKQSLPLMQLFQSATIEEIAAQLRQQASPAPPSPLLPIHASGRRRPFFCVHPIGGHALCYLDLASHLDPEQPFYGLQAIGLYDDRDPIGRLEEMAARYVDELRHIQAQGPYQLGGWSFGGLVALEMAQQLQAQGQRVALLALLDTRLAVGQRRRGPDGDNGETIRRLRTAVSQRLGHDLPVSDEDLRWLGVHDWRTLREQAESIEAAQVRRLLRVYAANYQALSHYRPRPYPGQITLFLAQEHTRQASQAIIKEWQGLSAGVKVYMAPGTHQTIVSQPHVRFLARSLQERLNDVR